MPSNIFFSVFFPQFFIISTEGRADVSYSTTATLGTMLLDVVTVLQWSLKKRNSLNFNTFTWNIYKENVCVWDSCQMTPVVGVDEGVRRDRWTRLVVIGLGSLLQKH